MSDTFIHILIMAFRLLAIIPFGYFLIRILTTQSYINGEVKKVRRITTLMCLTIILLIANLTVGRFRIMTEGLPANPTTYLSLAVAILFCACSWYSFYEFKKLQNSNNKGRK